MKKTITDYLTVLLGTGVGRGIAFFNSIIIARALGKEDFGKFTIFFVVMVLTWMFPQAFDTVFVRYAKTAKDENHKNEFLRVSFFLKSVYAIAGLILAYPIAKVLSTACFKKPEVSTFIVLAIISGIFQAFLMTIASIYQEREHFNIFSFLYASYTISIFIGLLLLKYASTWFNLNNVIAIHVLVSIAIGCASIFLLFNRKIKRLWPLNQECLAKSFRMGKWVFWSAVMGFAFSRVDTLLLPMYVLFEDIGTYGVAQQITMLISVLIGSLANVFLPKACAAARSKEELRRYLKSAAPIVLVIILSILGLMVFARGAINILYGARYISGTKITQVLLGGWLFAVFFMPFGSLFYAFEDSLGRFLVDTFRFTAAIVLVLFLAPKYGVIGAAWGMTFAHILYCVFGFLTLGIRYRRYQRF